MKSKKGEGEEKMDERKIFAVIGVGNLGGYYVKSLASYQGEAILQICDPSEDAIQRAKTLFEEAVGGNQIELEVCSNIGDLRKHIDILAVATGSKPRRGIVEAVFQGREIRYMILEKVLFPCIEDYGIVHKLIKDKGCKTWVNCTRRLNPAYAKVKSFFEGEKHITFKCSGGEWGLSCNIIHIIDLMCYLTGGPQGLVVSADHLYPETYESKRAGYLEFFGTVEGKTDSCDYFAISSEKGAEAKTIITIQSERKVCVIKEFELKVTLASLEDGWQCETISIPPLYQSQITAPLFAEILQTGSCLLPDYETSSQEHCPMIETFNQYLFRITGKEHKLCPIT